MNIYKKSTNSHSSGFISRVILNSLLKTILCSTIGMVIASSSYAETLEEKAVRIAKKSDAADIGYTDEKSNVDMILLHRDGTRVVRTSHWRIKERYGEGDLRFYVFDTPEDQRGSAILSYGHVDKADEQWLYLPSINRSIKISSQNRSGSFVGSEFSYEDINSQEIPKFKWRYLREDTLRGRKVHVSERRPLDPYSGYSKQHLWVDQEHLYSMRIESFDRKGEHLKTAEITGWYRHDDKYWRQGQIQLTNMHNKNISTLIFKNRRIGTGIPDSDFELSAFKQGKTLFNDPSFNDPGFSDPGLNNPSYKDTTFNDISFNKKAKP